MKRTLLYEFEAGTYDVSDEFKRGLAIYDSQNRTFSRVDDIPLFKVVPEVIGISEESFLDLTRVEV